MSAYSRNLKVMAALGVKAIEWQENHGHTAVWKVTLENGDVLTVETHVFGTDTGVLRQLGKTLKPKYV